MATLSDAELAILGLLVEQPRHGYEIEQVIAERGMREWTAIGFSSIYAILGRLAKRGLATATAVASPGRGPGRRVHAATPAGRRAWHRATLAALSTPVPTGGSLLLGLAGIGGLAPQEAAAALAARTRALRERRRALAEQRAAQAPLPWFADALFSHGLAMLDAEHAWVSTLAGAIPPELPASEPSPTEVPTMPAAPATRRQKPFVPEITVLPGRTMAVVHTRGDPGETGPRAFPALYGAVYGLKFALRKQGIEFSIEPPCARWFAGPGWKTVPRDEWTAAWAIPVPDDTTDLPQKDPATPVVLERWDYGDVAQVLHVGAYADEEPTIDALHAFIADQGWEVAGPHEEVYLSRPGVPNQKTVIRYQVRRRS